MMMSTSPPLFLDTGQAQRLLLYMQEYRRSALMYLPPTQERNTTLRLVQALQGKLLVLCEQKSPQVYLAMTQEEVRGLQSMTKSLLQLYSEKPDSSTRAVAIADIGKLYAYLKRAYG